jgi:superfamily II DNA or RNA helicase
MSSKPPLSLSQDDDGHLIAGVGPGTGLAFLTRYFPGSQTIRIASAYFSLAGYKIGRENAPAEVQFHVLVGREEGPHVHKAILEEVRAELQNAETDLWAAVLDLVNRMETGRFTIRDARSMQAAFHCKFYICDRTRMWHGSANYSKNGLKYNAEQVTLSTSPKEIELFTTWFDSVAAEARDLLAELIPLLRRWLELAVPFDAFLKILYLLNPSLQFVRGSGAHAPTYYQEAVVARGLSQLQEYGGALIVLATGLGKTVVGAELAWRLFRSDQSEHMILLAPQAVREPWEAELDGRRLHHSFFPTDVLFRPDSHRRHHQISRILKRLSTVDERTVIVVDEAHFYRNQLLSEKQRKQPSRVFQRLQPAVRAGAKIILLTATAYGTDRQNLNSLLRLLPPRHKGVLDVFGAWCVEDLEEFRKLPVVTILGLPDVLSLARRRGDVDGADRPYISLAIGRRYLPEAVKLVPKFFDLPYQADLQQAFDQGYFSHASKRPTFGFDDETGEIESATDSAYNTAITAWMSSPPALMDFISQSLATEDQYVQLSLEEAAHQNVEDTSPDQIELLPDVEFPSAAARAWGRGGYAPFKLGREARQGRLGRYQEKLSDVSDAKLHELCHIVRSCVIENSRKVLIFTRWHRTALYLLRSLEGYFPMLRIGCTVEEQQERPGLKSRHARDELLRSFSPGSHGEAVLEESHVLICTDADGVGVNLQDADVVVNYDPPPAADVLFQRAGRVLRMTSRPDRIVTIYTMIPSMAAQEQSSSHVSQDIRQRFTRLSRRHDKSRAIIGSTVLTPAESIDLMQEGKVDVEEWFRNGDLASAIGRSEQGKAAEDTELLEAFRERAEALPVPLHSALVTSRFQSPRVAVLLEHEGMARLILFNPEEARIEPYLETQILDLLRCDEDASPGLVRLEEVERIANEAIRTWCRQRSNDIAAVKKHVAVYLQPFTDMPGTRQLLIEIN